MLTSIVQAHFAVLGAHLTFLYSKDTVIHKLIVLMHYRKMGSKKWENHMDSLLAQLSCMGRHSKFHMRYSS